MKKYIVYHFPWQILMAALFFQSSISQIPITDIGIDWFDKILHFVVFGILGFLMARSLKYANFKQLNSNFVIWSIIICSIYGAMDEIHQLYVPGRFATVGDWVADVLGIIVFVLLYQKILSRRFQSIR